MEANPIPVKWALARLGLIEEGIRLPLTWLSEKYFNDVEAAMKKAGRRSKAAPSMRWSRLPRNTTASTD